MHTVPAGYDISCHGIRQTLKGSFSAVSKPNFASKYAFETGTLTLSENGLREEKNNNYFNGVFKK